MLCIIPAAGVKAVQHDYGHKIAGIRILKEHNESSLRLSLNQTSPRGRAPAECLYPKIRELQSSQTNKTCRQERFFNSQEEGRKNHPRHQTVLGRKAHPPTTGIDLETFRTAGSAKGLLCLLWANHLMRRCLGRRHRMNFLPYTAHFTFTLRASTPL